MIPKYEQIMLPLLTILGDGKEHQLSNLVEQLATHFKLSEDEKRQLLPSGKQPLFRNRVGWARSYMAKAGLIDSVKRGRYTISSRGKSVLKEKPKDIDAAYLMKFKEFVDFVTPGKGNGSHGMTKTSSSDPTARDTPEETLEYAYQNLMAKLGKDLLEQVKRSSPEFFEQLVVDLLLKMGYGGSRKDAGEAIGKSNDGGIDGLIKEDKLGLDIIYIQAKRWQQTVPTREIRDFAGALLAQKARKGIFITTSSFPKSALEFVEKIDHKIILMDGQDLTRYMIEYNIGLSVSDTFEIKKIDTDYFDEEA